MQVPAKLANCMLHRQIDTESLACYRHCRCTPRSISRAS
uniref:Uncharacterized protein n=1 Tax=Anguilla anguilla TaxID=7936 RepID=A0A0E9TAI9_ANGAN